MNLIPENQADMTTDVFVGMWRPPLSEVLRGVEFIPSILGREENFHGYLNDQGKPVGVFRDSQQARNAWLRGDFDSALYQRVRCNP